MTNESQNVFNAILEATAVIKYPTRALINPWLAGYCQGVNGTEIGLPVGFANETSEYRDGWLCGRKVR